jgi:hypothetical protein
MQTWPSPRARSVDLGWLQKVAPRRYRGVTQHRIQMLASQRPAPGLLRGAASIAIPHRRRSASPAARRVNEGAATPQAFSTGMVVAEMNSPQTLRRGNSAFSTSATRQPACASSRAAADPPDRRQ